jgi:ribosomal protein L11 methyltransferase
VGAERAEPARAIMLELFPQGFEEVDRENGGVELIAYTDASGEERLWQAFGGAQASDVEEGWEDRWRDFHRPVQVGRLWVGPPWESPPDGARTLVIDPGRAFGTGAHPTTRLCLELLQDDELGRGSVLDVGCGSGVLSIAAALLGYAAIHAVDVEAAAVEATRENAAVNGVELTVELVAADALLPPADVVVANISAASVAALDGRISATHVVSSGYLVPDEPKLTGYQRIERHVLEGWAADLHRRI